MNDEFDQAYRAGVPPWDVGHPQPEFVALDEAGWIVGQVLDAGCGTGENALYLASRGHEVVGVDLSPTAIARARTKASERGVDVAFLEGDALDLPALGRTFDTVVDSGVFHVFDDPDRARYVASLGRALPPGGRYAMLVFSERQPGDWGPRRVTEREIDEAFAEGWTVEEVRPALFDTNTMGDVQAWLGLIVRGP